MKTLRTKWPFLVCMIFLLLITYSIYRMSRRQFFMANANCIKPFHEFAFLPDETPRPISEILPGSPWQVEATIPGIENVATAQIELARTINGKEEIWLFNDPFIAANAEESFVIYYPHSTFALT
jgi:hypothetical protein